MQKVELRFLTPKEMKNARDMDTRYEGVDSDNLGFSDPVKNRIYVRAGLEKDLTSYLIDHELSHLTEEKGTHEDEYGIRHKKGGFLKNFYDPLGIFHEGNALGVGPNQGKSGLGDIPGVTQGVNLGLGAINPFLGAAGQAMSSMGKGQQEQTSPNGFGQMFPSSTVQSFGQGFGQQGAPSPSGSGPQGGQSTPMANMGLGAGLPNQANISMGQGGNNDQAQQQRQQGFWFPSYKF